MTNVPWCEDFEKMISGMLYKSMAPELAEVRFRGRRFNHRYNAAFTEYDDATMADLEKMRASLLEKGIGSVGENCMIEVPVSVDYGCNISIGNGVFANYNLVILDCAPVNIGNDVSFGPNVGIYTATHGTELDLRNSNLEYALSVIIGDDCWIGGGATILAGVTIGKGCTIGAGSVVTRDIPDYSVAYGVPAKVVKKVTPPPNDKARVDTE